MSDQQKEGFMSSKQSVGVKEGTVRILTGKLCLLNYSIVIVR